MTSLIMSKFSKLAQRKYKNRHVRLRGAVDLLGIAQEISIWPYEQVYAQSRMCFQE